MFSVHLSNARLTRSIYHFSWITLAENYWLSSGSAMLCAYGITPMMVNLYVNRSIDRSIHISTTTKSFSVYHHNDKANTSTNLPAASTPTSPSAPYPPSSNPAPAQTATTPHPPSSPAGIAT